MYDPNPPAWEQQAEAWDAACEGYAAQIATRTAPFAADIIDLLGLPRGARFLDVACGSGVVAMRAARVGLAVVAIDFSAKMIEYVARAAECERLQIDVRQMDGQRLALPDQCFAGAASLFGLQFFPDRHAGLCELRRVVVNGGRVAIGAWAGPDRVEFLTPLLRALQRALPAMAGPQEQPLLYRLSNEMQFITELREAGFREMRIVERDHPYIFADANEYWRLLSTAAPASMRRIAALPHADREAVRAALIDELRDLFGSGPIALGAAARIAVGHV